MIEADAKLISVLIGGNQKLLTVFDRNSEKAEFLPMNMTVIVTPDYAVYNIAHTG